MYSELDIKQTVNKTTQLRANKVKAQLPTLFRAVNTKLLLLCSVYRNRSYGLIRYSIFRRKHKSNVSSTIYSSTKSDKHERYRVNLRITRAAKYICPPESYGNIIFFSRGRKRAIIPRRDRHWTGALCFALHRLFANEKITRHRVLYNVSRQCNAQREQLVFFDRVSHRFL